jgi:NAD(P)-dependent dehydrogenase (short-subunit alcohol dehydrogenase family)
LGATVASVLARRGFDLILSARGVPDLERVAVELRALGSGARGVGVRGMRAGGLGAGGPDAADVGAGDVGARDVDAADLDVRAVAGDLVDERTREGLVRAVARFGGLDLLVNNASELGGGLSALADFDSERFERLLQANVVAPLELVRVLLPLLEARRGLVVNVSSDAAQGAYAGWGAYGATKAALDLISRTLAVELRERGVSVVSVDPGDMRTRMHQEAFPGEDISDRPLPEVTIPFWEWLLDQPGSTISGERFQAQTGDARWAVRV